MLHSEKRVRILALIEHCAPPRTIVERATKPPADADYERRLRMWAADCAARALHLIAKHHVDYLEAGQTIIAARNFAKDLIHKTHLAQFATLDSRPKTKGKRVSFYMASEVKQAAAMTAQADVHDAARAAAQHACNAIRSAMLATRRDVGKQWDDELNWQIERLRAWLSDDEPAEWPISAADFREIPTSFFFHPAPQTQPAESVSFEYGTDGEVFYRKVPTDVSSCR